MNAPQAPINSFLGRKFDQICFVVRDLEQAMDSQANLGGWRSRRRSAQGSACTRGCRSRSFRS
jgi:hypothetical protein